LLLHGLGVLLVQAVGQATVFILPVLARKEFGANDWQTLLVTAPPTILFVFSIFWSGLFSRLGFGKSLSVYFIVACLPIAFISQASTYLWMIIPYLVASAGGAAWPVLSGSLLKSLYGKQRQAKAYSTVWGASMLCSAGLGSLVGNLLTQDGESFRDFMPIAVAMQLLGVFLLWVLGRRANKGLGANMGTSVHTQGSRSLFGGLLHEITSPIKHMGEVLRADPAFARYESAYMTYGAGWMIGYALLPIIATTKLGLTYEQIANSTHVPYLLALVACLVPAAIALDKLGAAKSTAISFGLLTLYPLGLIFVQSERDLIFVSAFYGIAHAGASVGWMLGPVSLAPSADKVPAYVAIHATLVGLRGALFQLVGVALSKLSGGFVWPLALAAAAYVWSAWQMYSLARLRTNKPGA
jgi:MFS family permease